MGNVVTHYLTEKIIMLLNAFNVHIL